MRTSVIIVVIICAGTLFLAYRHFSEPRKEYDEPEYKNIESVRRLGSQWGLW